MDDDLTDSTYAAKSQFLVAGLFPEREKAEVAFDAIANRGYGKDNINLVMLDATRQRCFNDGGMEASLAAKSDENTSLGGPTGGTAGAVAGAVAAVGTSLLLPGLDIVVAGPLAAGFTGAGVGGVTGGVAGALAGMGIPHEYVKTYEDGIKRGDILMLVQPWDETDAAFIEQRWKDSGAQHLHLGQGDKPWLKPENRSVSPG